MEMKMKMEIDASSEKVHRTFINQLLASAL